MSKACIINYKKQKPINKDEAEEVPEPHMLYAGFWQFEDINAANWPFFHLIYILRWIRFIERLLLVV
jgi:hypothetical protein